MTQPATLFARRDRLTAALHAIDALLDAERRKWSFEHGFRVPVRPEAFRREVTTTKTGERL